MEWLLDWGYLGLFLGSLMAATVVPFSSDFLLLGMLAAGGNIVWTVVWASLGNWVGGMISYTMGWWGRWEWIERWFRVKRETLEKQRDTIAKYGSWLAFLSWLPFVGDLFAIGLGFYKVDYYKVAVFMLIGKALRFVGWAFFFVWIKPYFS